MKQLSEQAKLLKDYNKRKITKDKAQDVIAGWLDSNKYTMKELEMLFYLLDIKEDDFEYDIYIDPMSCSTDEIIKQFKEGKISKNDIGRILAFLSNHRQTDISEYVELIDEIGLSLDDFVYILHPSCFRASRCKYIGRYDKNSKEEKDDYVEEGVEIGDMMNQEEVLTEEDVKAIEEEVVANFSDMIKPYVNKTDKIETIKPMIDYDRKYYIYEVFTLLENMPEGTRVIDGEQLYDWKLNERKNSLIRRDELVNEYKDIDNYYFLKDILNMTFKLVKEEKEGAEEWVEIKSLMELIRLLTDDRVASLKIDNKIYPMEDLTGASSLSIFQATVLNRYTLDTLDGLKLKNVNISYLRK